MRPTTTLVLPPRYTEDSNAVGRAAARAGWDVERLPHWRVPDWLKERRVVFYGEPLFAQVVAPQLGLALIEPTADWLPKLPEAYRRRDVRLTTLAEAKRVDGAAFIKPPGEKCFPARVFASGKALAEAVPDSAGLPGDTPVLVAEPVRWELEFRCFVLRRRVVTFSPYLREGELALDAEGCWASSEAEDRGAIGFAERVLGDSLVEAPPAVVLDVGRIAGRGWAVVELNSAFGSGIYGCSPDLLLPVLERATVKRDQLTAEDLAWVVEQ